MRILIHGLNFAPEPTGIGKFTGAWAHYLAERGADVRVVTAPAYYPEWRVQRPFHSARYQRESHETGCGRLTVIRCPLWVPAHPSGTKRLVHLASFTLASLPVMLAQAAWRPSAVIAVAPALSTAPQAWLTARLGGAPSWLHVQDFEVDAAFAMQLMRGDLPRRVLLSAEGALLRRFDRVSTISAAMRQRLLSRGVPAARAPLFPNWVDLDQIRPDPEAGQRFRRREGIPPEQLVALYSGNMGEKQGLELLLEMAGRMAERPDFTLVMCGDGGAKERLMRAAQGLANIHWLPLQPVERLNELLNAADIHLLPQRAGAADLVMPSKLTGILACGGPVIATAEVGTELAQAVAAAGGVRISPEDPAALVHELHRLGGERTALHEMRAAARAYAEAHLGQDSILGSQWSQLQALVDERVSSGRSPS